MTQEEKIQLQEGIENKIKETEQNIAELEELTAPVAPDVAIGRISRMDAINNKSVAEAALRVAQSKLGRLKVALTKIDDPGFGYCTRCKGAIPFKRLLLMPESTRCVRCSV